MAQKPPLNLLDTGSKSLTIPFSLEPTLSYGLLSPEIAQHTKSMEKIVRKCIPEPFFQLSILEFQNKLLPNLPLLVWNKPKTAPACIEICCLTLSSQEEITENQILDILKSWILPGKTTPLLSMRVLHFHWDLFPHEAFMALQAKVLLKNEKELHKALAHLPSLSAHILSSLQRPSLFKHFFSKHPLLEDLKNARVHKELVFLLEKFPSVFDSSLFVEMSRFFSLSPKSFFLPRTSRLITKIISTHFLMKERLQQQLSLYPEKRHLMIRFIRTKLDFFFGSKPVLGLVVGITPLDKHEFFEEGHIVEAVQTLIPNAQCVQGSFYTYRGREDPVCTIYIELEKKDGSLFLIEEVTLLKQELEDELKRRIEKLVPSVFMIRNEEETMRNILILSQELKYLSDLPQVMISLEKQTSLEVIFIVILVRLERKNQPSLLESFYPLHSKVRFSSDRVQHVGFVRKNHPKEAHVFHLKIPKDSSLLRADYSLNFYLARQKIASLLTQAIGPFRDYNGGMILKQGELFYQFKESFSTIAEKNPELLENFFFSLNPIEKQATLPLSSLQILFEQLLEAKEASLLKKDDYFVKTEEKKEKVFALIRTHDISCKEEIQKSLIQAELWTKSLIHTQVSIQGSFYIGLILIYPDQKKHQIFLNALQAGLSQWKNKLRNKQIARLSFSYLPSSLDPRVDDDESSCVIAKMLFEGLTRLNAKGNPEPALAESILISDEGKKYTFHLKKSLWSDGSAVTAHDFERSWKKILSPPFSTPYSYLLHPIKNAQKAKEGLCSLDDVSVEVLNDHTLIVSLETQTPEFLHLTALPIYFPVPHLLDKTHPDWGLRMADHFVCNGPFFLKRALSGPRYELAKNPSYWDKDHVKLKQINLSKDSSLFAHSLFKNEETDWLGMPLRPWESFFEEHKTEEKDVISSGVHWTICNTQKFPLHSVSLRRALRLAISIKELVTRLPRNCVPALSPLPLSHTMNDFSYELEGNEKKAVEAFEMALEELKLSRKQLPLLTIIFPESDLREKAARYLVEKWRALFHIPCRIEKYEYSVFCTKLTRSDFQIALLHWKPPIDHPLYTLKIFKHSQDMINFAKWSDSTYTGLLDLAQNTSCDNKKISLLAAAEKILLEQTPLIPLFYEKEKIIKKPYLQKVFYSKTTGNFDIKQAYIQRH